MERIIYLYSGRADSLSRRIEEDFTELVGPIHPKVFFSPLTDGLLGLYESSRGCIFISDGLIRQPYDTVRQEAIHELAHWRNHVETGSLEHDASFRRWCRILGCDEDHSKARIAVIHRSGVIDKVRKLKSLSSSPFEAESQAAMRKVRQLVVQYSLEEAEEDDEESICWCDLYQSSRRIASSRQRLCQMAALQTGVYLVQTRTVDTVGIRAYGRRGELEVASYLVDVLHSTIEQELKDRRRREPDKFRGVTGTNSFYDGVYTALRQRKEAEAGDDVGYALSVVERDNERLTRTLVYRDRKLVTRRTRHRYEPGTFEDGREFGHSIQIRKGVSKDRADTLLLT